MDQKKIGIFLKELRNQRGITQEQLAEVLYTSRRTISRWETGRNLPDLSVLVELSAYYDVDLREILAGERKQKKMDEALKDTVLKAAEYENEGKKTIMRRLNLLFVVALLGNIIALILRSKGYENSALTGVCDGFAGGMLLVGIIITSRYAKKLEVLKARYLQKREAAKAERV